MAKTLLEAYHNRLAISEKVYAKDHAGQKLDDVRKLMIAKSLQNIDRFMTESFASGEATQFGRSASSALQD